MSVFNAYIHKVDEYVNRLKEKGNQMRIYESPLSVDELRTGLPVNVGPNANPGIILMSDTAVELGNPLAGSCAFVLWSKDPSVINNGKITHIGPDISESQGASLPFGQIIMVAGKNLADKNHESLMNHQYVGYQIEGYMLKSAPDKIWGRVSNSAAEKGFDFQTLGKAMMSIFRADEPGVEAIEIVFVTSAKEDVQELTGIAEQIKKISREIVKENWKVKGYDIDCDFDCSSCSDKSVCDDIREVVAVRKKKEN